MRSEIAGCNSHFLSCTISFMPVRIRNTWELIRTGFFVPELCERSRQRLKLTAVDSVMIPVQAAYLPIKCLQLVGASPKTIFKRKKYLEKILM